MTTPLSVLPQAGSGWPSRQTLNASVESRTAAQKNHGNGYATLVPGTRSSAERSNLPTSVDRGRVVVSHTCTLKIQNAPKKMFLVTVIACVPPTTGCKRKTAPCCARAGWLVHSAQL